VMWAEFTDRKWPWTRGMPRETAVRLTATG
jgi:hypothetical protein